MAGQYTEIPWHEMDSFLKGMGFQEIELEGTTEKVYGKIVMDKVTLRVYTSIAYGTGRPVGQDAIRLTLVTKLPDGQIKPIGKSQKVYRIATWRDNLTRKMKTWNEYFGPPCPKCNNHTVHRDGKWGGFWGCVMFPSCRGSARNDA